MKPTILATLFGMATSLASATTTIDSIVLPGGTSAVGAYTLASVYGQPTSLEVASANNRVLEPGFLCIEADDITNPGDLNHDGLVNGVDLAIVLSNWGACESGPCPGDIDRDGLVNGVDLAIVLSNWG
jgi:hypothetical protein